MSVKNPNLVAQTYLINFSEIIWNVSETFRNFLAVPENERNLRRFLPPQSDIVQAHPNS